MSRFQPPDPDWYKSVFEPPKPLELPASVEIFPRLSREEALNKIDVAMASFDRVLERNVMPTVDGVVERLRLADIFRNDQLLANQMLLREFGTLIDRKDSLSHLDAFAWIPGEILPLPSICIVDENEVLTANNIVTFGTFSFDKLSRMTVEVQCRGKQGEGVAVWEAGADRPFKIAGWLVAVPMYRG